MFGRINLILKGRFAEELTHWNGALDAMIESVSRIVIEVIRPAIQSGKDGEIKELLSILSKMVEEKGSVLQIALLGGLNAEDIRALAVANRRIGVDLSGLLNATPQSHRMFHEHSTLKTVLLRGRAVQNGLVPNLVYSGEFISAQRDIILALSELTSLNAILESALVIDEFDIIDPECNDLLAAISYVLDRQPYLSRQWSAHCEHLRQHPQDLHEVAMKKATRLMQAVIAAASTDDDDFVTVLRLSTPSSREDLRSTDEGPERPASKNPRNRPL